MTRSHKSEPVNQADPWWREQLLPSSRPLFTMTIRSHWRKEILRRVRSIALKFRSKRLSTLHAAALFIIVTFAVVLLVALCRSLLNSDRPAKPFATGRAAQTALKNMGVLGRNIAHVSSMWKGNEFAVEGGVEDLSRLLGKIVPNTTTLHPHVSSSLQIVVRRPNVTVLAVNYAYRELAMNLICNLKRLGIENYVVLAMDRAVFVYIANRQGNVFYHSRDARHTDDESDPDKDVLPVSEEEDSKEGDDSDEGDVFGSSRFVRTSQRKSMMLAEVVMLGYDVLFCDADIILYRNPHERLADYAEDFVIMSDRRHDDLGAPLNYNVNSGFYFVRGNGRNFLTLRAIVKYGSKTKRSEQKAFNHVLCGAYKDEVGGRGWRFGENRCFYRALGGVTIRVLSSEEFANGSDELMFQRSPEQILQMYGSLIALHVNYVAGRNEKISRIKKIGQWFYDPNGGRGTDGCLSMPLPGDINRNDTILIPNLNEEK